MHRATVVLDTPEQPEASDTPAAARQADFAPASYVDSYRVYQLSHLLPRSNTPNPADLWIAARSHKLHAAPGSWSISYPVASCSHLAVLCRWRHLFLSLQRPAAEVAIRGTMASRLPTIPRVTFTIIEPISL